MEPADIIQITDETHHWFPALLVVSEVKSWGVQAFAFVPESNAPGSHASQAYIRIETGRFERVGARAIIMPAG